MLFFLRRLHATIAAGSHSSWSSQSVTSSRDMCAILTEAISRRETDRFLETANVDFRDTSLSRWTLDRIGVVASGVSVACVRREVDVC